METTRTNKIIILMCDDEVNPMCNSIASSFSNGSSYLFLFLNLNFEFIYAMESNRWIHGHMIFDHFNTIIKSHFAAAVALRLHFLLAAGCCCCFGFYFILSNMCAEGVFVCVRICAFGMRFDLISSEICNTQSEPKRHVFTDIENLKRNADASQ